MPLKTTLGRFAVLRVLLAVWRTLRDQFGLNLRWLGGVKGLVIFASEYRTFKKLSVGSRYEVSARNIFPTLTDRTVATPIEPVYFFQDLWFSARIHANLPATHVDVGSSIKAMSMLAQFFPVRFVDIRTIDVEVPNLEFVEGSILELPFPDGSIDSLSSLCVVEHIGLGRYGDPLDGFGTEKAVAELIRVLAKGGNLYVSVPVDDRSRVYFNAHRAFTRAHVLSLFGGLALRSESYIYGVDMVSHYREGGGFGTGLFHFTKP